MSASQPNESFNNNSQPGDVSTTTTSSPEASRCFWQKSLDPRVIDLIYWRDVQRSALLLSSSLVLLLSFVMFSVLSVVAYTSLIVMTITLSFRIYKNITAAVYKTGEGHPFQRYLDMDISLRQTTLNDCSEQASGQLLILANMLRSVFLVEDMFDSLKFYAILYLMTYIGAMFNFTTLVIFADIALFTLPKTYEIYEVEINQLVDMIRKQFRALSDQVKQYVNQAAGLKKKL